MSNFFSYESKPMQILMLVGDLIILNIVYLLCCLPIFTIGAAQAGMYSAAKVMLDKEDDSSLTAAFFKGFRSGFGTVTAAWGLATLVLAFVAFTGYNALYYGGSVWLVGIGLFICGWFSSLIPVFHSRFGCTVLQLLRNAALLMFAHPLRSLGVFILLWIPVVVLFFVPGYFMLLTPIWIMLYYSTAMIFGFTFMRKPFQTLIDHFNETHKTEETKEEEEETESPVLPE